MSWLRWRWSRAPHSTWCTSMRGMLLLFQSRSRLSRRGMCWTGWLLLSVSTCLRCKECTYPRDWLLWCQSRFLRYRRCTCWLGWPQHSRSTSLGDTGCRLLSLLRACMSQRDRRCMPRSMSHPKPPSMFPWNRGCMSEPPWRPRTIQRRRGGSSSNPLLPRTFQPGRLCTGQRC